LSDDNDNSSNKKEKPAPAKQDDLLNINEPSASTEPIKPEQPNDDIFQQEGENKFDINNFQGFPMEQWVKYQGSINDTKQRRRVAISGLEKFKCRYNRSNDDDLPEWDILELQYHPITVKAWQKRQSDTAEIEDKQRAIGAVDLQLSEIQNSVRIRTLNANKPRVQTNTNQTLEDLQKSVTSIQNMEKSLKKSFQERKNEADRYAFKIYFHQPADMFDKIRADDLDDIIGACDWKQTQGPANLLPSKNLPMPVQPGVK
jgi:hypothetical protein